MGQPKKRSAKPNSEPPLVGEREYQASVARVRSKPLPPAPQADVEAARRLASLYEYVAEELARPNISAADREFWRGELMSVLFARGRTPTKDERRVVVLETIESAVARVTRFDLVEEPPAADRAAGIDARLMPLIERTAELMLRELRVRLPNGDADSVTVSDMAGAIFAWSEFRAGNRRQSKYAAVATLLARTPLRGVTAERLRDIDKKRPKRPGHAVGNRGARRS